ncbi:uncharacterized protein TNCV_4695241 [Trichonephila clavipes]|nr:uncharacterized protein TNCV_4695241 [Trichonephila clavipes]
MTTTSYRSRSAVGVRHLFFASHYSAVRSCLGARGTMTTTSYRSHSAVGVRHLFSVEALLCCPVASWCTRNDDNDILPQNARAVGVRHFFPSRHYSAVRSRLGARGTNDDNDILPQPLGGGCSSLFSVEALLCCPVASWCTRNDDNDILPQPRGGGCSSLFSVEALLCCPVASWCTRNDDNDILPQPRAAVGVRHLFPSRHYSAVRSRLGARGTMTTISYRAARRWVFVTFSVELLLCCPVASWCTRNDDNDILPQPLGGGCSSLFSSRHYSAVRSRLGARGTMTTTSYRVRSAVGVRHLFSVEALFCCPVASWCTRNDDNDILPQPLGGGCSSPFFRRGTTLLSGRVLVHAER